MTHAHKTALFCLMVAGCAVPLSAELDLVNFSKSPDTVDVTGAPGTVTCTMNIPDGAGGGGGDANTMRYAACSFKSPDGRQAGCLATSAVGDNWSCDVTIPADSEGSASPGTTWTIEYVFAENVAGDKLFATGTEIEADQADGEVDLKVISDAADTTPPTISAFTALPATVQPGGTVTCTITADDGAGSGIKDSGCTFLPDDSSPSVGCITGGTDSCGLVIPPTVGAGVTYTEVNHFARDIALNVTIDNLSQSFVTVSESISAVWAQSGEDKVTQDEVRGLPQTNAVYDSTAGTPTVTLDGMRNEVVSFNTVIEAANARANNVTVTMSNLTGPGTIRYAARPTADPDDLFDWTATEIELFYVKYLQIKGLSHLSYDYITDERQIPSKLQRPDPPNDDWVDRPNADKFYPEIAVPLELENGFDIVAGQNQQVWADIYIPNDIADGIYTGDFTITEEGQTPVVIPVYLTVHPEVMPDTTTAKRFTYIEESGINQRWAAECDIQQTGCYPDPGFPEEANVEATYDAYHKLFHRHRVDIMGGRDSSTALQTEWNDRLSGDLYTNAQGYSGPGEGVGNWIYVIGTYGDWQYSWNPGDAWSVIPADMSGINTIQGTWLSAMAAYPNTQFVQYLCDESPNCEASPGGEAWAAALKGTANGPFH